VFKSDSKKFSMDEFEELDKLSESINQIAADTSFTVLLKSEEKKKTDGETLVRKSAFDILEEFVNREESVRTNHVAAASETPMNVIEPKVVDLTRDDIIFNAPEIDEEFEALRARDIAEVEAEEMESLEQEALELENALNLAFEQLTGEKLEEGEMEVDLDGEISSLDLSVDLAIMKGKDFDLDLSFLNEVTTPNNFETSDEN
jgi:hypothetical protein